MCLYNNVITVDNPLQLTCAQIGNKATCYVCAMFVYLHTFCKHSKLGCLILINQTELKVNTHYLYCILSSAQHCVIRHFE